MPSVLSPPTGGSGKLTWPLWAVCSVSWKLGNGSQQSWNMPEALPWWSQKKRLLPRSFCSWSLWFRSSAIFVHRFTFGPSRALEGSGFTYTRYPNELYLDSFHAGFWDGSHSQTTLNHCHYSGIVGVLYFLPLSDCIFQVLFAHVVNVHLWFLKDFCPSFERSQRIMKMFKTHYNIL